MTGGLIINADDFGLTEDTNRAILELARLGTVSSTSIMVNMPYVAAIQSVAAEFPRLGVGVHLNLTTGAPLSPPETVRTLVDGEGRFLPLGVLVRRALTGRVSWADIRREVRAQVRRARELLGARLDHWDSHEGFHRFEPFATLCMAVCREQGVPAMRSHRHYFITSAQPLALRRPNLATLGLFGWGRVAREQYYGLLSWRAARHFALPTGLLALTEGPTLDILDVVAGADLPPGVWEVACHPAMSTQGLSEAETTHQARTEEYALLASERFRRAVANGRLTMLNFSQLVG